MKAPIAINDNPKIELLCNHAPTKTITKLAPKDAPLETPINDGAARGFQKRPCITAPLIASITPTKRARHNRGNRMWNNMVWICAELKSVSFGRKKALTQCWITISIGIFTAPVLIPAIATNGKDSNKRALNCRGRILCN